MAAAWLATGTPGQMNTGQVEGNGLGFGPTSQQSTGGLGLQQASLETARTAKLAILQDCKDCQDCRPTSKHLAAWWS